MIKSTLIKLKITFKRLLGKCIYFYVYIKKTLKTLLLNTNQGNHKTRKKHKKNIFNFIALLAEKWKLSCTILIAFFIIYYGIGATISGNINNSLEKEIKSVNTRYTTASIEYVLKSQLNDSIWAPALPIFFPASILDNLPNFQIGVKDSTRYIIKRLSLFHNDKNLKDASLLLDYPATIWLFSHTSDNKLAPGSAKQYRKALSHIKKYSQNVDTSEPHNPKELFYILTTLNNILNTQIDILHKQYLEHHNEFFDNKSDNLFYYAKGNIFTVYYLLDSLAKDYQNYIISSDQYDNLTSALNYLKDAQKLEPLIIKNNATTDFIASNHLLYLAYYISRAQNFLQEIMFNLNQFIKE